MTVVPFQRANPVRTREARVRAGRVVQVRFTDFARLAAQGGLLTMYGPSPEQAVCDLVRRLGIPAQELQPKPQQLGDLAILRRMPADTPREYLPGTLQPVAFVEGLSLSEIQEGLEYAANPLDQARLAAALATLNNPSNAAAKAAKRGR